MLPYGSMKDVAKSFDYNVSLIAINRTIKQLRICQLKINLNNVSLYVPISGFVGTVSRTSGILSAGGLNCFDR